MGRILLISFLGWTLSGSQSWAESWAFVGVTVIPMTQEKVLPQYTVLVEDGTITGVGPIGSVALPPAVRRIDGENRYLMPGLAEMHAHIPQATGAQERVLSLYVINGITTARGMLGHPDHLGLRKRIDEGSDDIAPRIITAGPSLNGNSVDGKENAAKKVRAQKKAGYDFLKLHPGLTRTEFDAIVETAQELDIPFAGHVSTDVGLARALEAQQDSIDHLDGYMQMITTLPQGETLPAADFFGVFLGHWVDPQKIQEIAKQTAAAKVWNVPTQTLFENVVSNEDPKALKARPEMRYVNASTLEQWTNAKQSMQQDQRYSTSLAHQSINARRQLIKALNDAGAGLLLGSDAPQIFNVPGFSIHRELQSYVEAGLSPYQALVTGTINPALYFGKSGQFGGVAEGQAADLILLRGNPLENIANTQSIDGVMVRGRWLARSDLDRMLVNLEE